MLENILLFKNKNTNSQKPILVNFESGIIGFNFCKNFLLKKTSKLKKSGEIFLLESIELDSLKFILLKSFNNNLYTLEEDILHISEVLNVNRNDLTFFYITNNSKTTETINTKAPIIIDTSLNKGYQFVLDRGYKIKQIIED